jgi:hypothetical protein
LHLRQLIGVEHAVEEFHFVDSAVEDVNHPVGKIVVRSSHDKRTMTLTSGGR